MEPNDDNSRLFAALTRDTMVSHYRIIEKIGSGGMGEVYLAEDTKLNRQVALKFLPTNFASDKTLKTRFISEARAAARLNHPHIITIHEVGDHNGRPFFAMEHVEGMTLSKIIDKDGLPTEEAIDIILQICEGLKEAHEVGIVHRDIKPTNIIIDKRGRCKILDFGLAAVQSEERLTKTGTLLGTVEYMSPEQIRGEKVDHRSDVFSLGILFFELLTGKLPFKSDHGPLAVYSILNESPKRLVVYKPDISEKLQLIIDKALIKDCDGRYPNISDLIEDLRLFKGGQDVLCAPTIGAEEKRLEIKSLAVLYLKNLGAPDDEYLSYGITKDLIVDLTRIGNIRVTPMRSIMKYKDSDDEIKDIAKMLDVSTILEGSIYKSDKSVRISAELIDVASGKNKWADRWEVQQENLPKIKQFIAEGVGQALEVESSIIKLAQVGKPEAQNPQAYEYYLRGKYAFEHKKEAGDIEVALGLYQKSLEFESTLLAARAGIAEIYLYKDEYEKADKDLSGALIDARKRQSKVDEANLLLLMTKSLTWQSRWDEAKEYANQALNIKRDLGDLVGEAEVIGSLIAIFRYEAKVNEALKCFNRVLEINRQLDDHQKEADALNAMGGIYYSIGKYDQARKLFEETKKIAVKRNDLYLEAKCIANIGVTYQYSFNRDQALVNYERAIQIFHQLNAHSNKAKLFHNMGTIHASHGFPRKAIKQYKKALDIYKKIGNRSEFSHSQINMGWQLMNIGKYDSALSMARQSLENTKDIDYPAIKAVSIRLIGSIQFCGGEYEKARENLFESLKIAEENDLKLDVVETLSRLGGMEYHLGNYELCREYLEKALNMAKELDQMQGEFEASAYYAALIIKEGQIKKGINQLRGILKRANELGLNHGILRTRRLLGQALLEHGLNKSERHEGYTLLQDSLAIIKEKEIDYEAKWIKEILNQHETGQLN